MELSRKIELLHLDAIRILLEGLIIAKNNGMSKKEAHEILTRWDKATSI